ncbi:ceramide glucosyltransferase, putative [Talaromyces stipitatus ATCC 10500]|uniref:Ceramide glucosyltransferase n=1 Tax=Talaromyces stipitatus (strain ATCC 10500 / CBS 375.48 / QM 6759 / NRRL 1006) TaxID=441959 RepID=B8M9N2_TALSN|nr:ceramide glucosyltransferase, putative [Talaromyces stipitatus ATCC 10500]EED18034.1 ceramide glucosyltransferase, putative [Talaromyces stipitatus ATCC 10500]
MATPRLEDLLAEAIPKGVQINVRHVSTTPTRCEAIFSAPPGQVPEITFCESHFLIVTINKNQDGEKDVVDDEIVILGVEVYIYTTDRLTTLFVSKADSTGYVHLSKASAEATTPRYSLLRLLTTTFISFLAQSYQRPGVRLVLSLFARAQNQYLFPGSADNERKHVLDDRGLIKWWCRAADPILREHAPESRQQQQQGNEKNIIENNAESTKSSATAYLLVPGCDEYETRAFFPPTARTDDNQLHPRWRVSYPLSQICGHPDAPPRCLVPRFPDDPKARFLSDLDDELPKNSHGDSETNNQPGHWRSVRSLDQFWEMMSFRQECSAGRLVGFLWLVINPPGLLSSDKLVNQGEASETVEKKEIQTGDKDLAPATTATEAKFDNRSLSALQHEDTQPSTTKSSTSGDVTGRSAFFWPEIGRGETILSETDYKVANDILLEQDFETEELAMRGTMAWIRKVASVSDVLWWGIKVTGKKKLIEPTQPSVQTQTITPGLIVRKRKKDAQEATSTTTTTSVGAERVDADKPLLETSNETGVNVLNASFAGKGRTEASEITSSAESETPKIIPGFLPSGPRDPLLTNGTASNPLSSSVVFQRATTGSSTTIGFDVPWLIEAFGWVSIGWYLLVVVVCALGYLQIWRLYSNAPPKSQSSRSSDAPHVTTIRPVKGIEPYLYECLASTLRQDYPRNKLTTCICVSTKADPAFPILEKVVEDFSDQCDVRIYVEEEDPLLQEESIYPMGPNPKIRNMSRAYREAKGDIIWIIDCNVWVGRGVCGRMVDKLCGYGPGNGGKRYKFVHHLPLAVNVDPEDALMGETKPLLSNVNGVYNTSSTSRTQSILNEGGGRLEELFLSSSHAKMYTAINTVSIAPCIVGKSNMFRKSHLNDLTESPDEAPVRGPVRNPGIDWVSDQLCEDHIIGDWLWRNKVREEKEQMKRLSKHGMVFGDYAFQPVANMSVKAYIARRVRWLRVRKYTVLAATLVEPGTESIVCSLYGAFGMSTVVAMLLENRGFEIGTYLQQWPTFFLLWATSIFIWCMVDWTLYLKLHSGATVEIDENTPPFATPLKSSKSPSRRPFLHWLAAWIIRESLAFPIWFWAVYGGSTVTWRNRSFQVSLWDTKAREVDGSARPGLLPSVHDSSYSNGNTAPVRSSSSSSSSSITERNKIRKD